MWDLHDDTAEGNNESFSEGGCVQGRPVITYEPGRSWIGP